MIQISYASLCALIDLADEVRILTELFMRVK